MFKNINVMLFISTLMLGTLISISSNSWIGAWMGLEINLLSFIPLLSSHNNMTTSESALKYFLTQALASSIMLFSILISLMNLKNITNLATQYILDSALLLKVGAAPFHFWFPEVMEGINWLMGFILMTWQKIAPFILLSYCLSYNYIYIIIILNIILGSIGGLNQTNLRSLMAYSSINHIGWMLSSLLISINFWVIYFILYSLISLSIINFFYKFNIFYFNQLFSSINNFPIQKFLLFCNFLSLGGLPPFTGFLPKWLIIQNLSLNHTFIICIMVIFTLLTLFFYIRVAYSAFSINSFDISWNKNSELPVSLTYLIMNFFSLFLLIMIIMVYNII
uniref:NADH-ubiquinone oxidoreductase chain 2 n=1 Tax=Chasmoptera huttii TaxID=1265314 RepID=A0A1S5QY16_9NEOP|nr:NADH dehydrogenase subunit 2 [Chasmoptera huttii]